MEFALYMLDAVALGVAFWMIWVALNVAEGLKDADWRWKIVFYALVIPGLIIDAVFNGIIATILFWELPRTATLSQRLTGHVKNGPVNPVWRTRLAVYIATTLVEPWAPGHIKLVRYGWPAARDTAKWLKKLFPKITNARL